MNTANHQFQPPSFEAIESMLVWEISDILRDGFKLERRALVEHLPKIGKVTIYRDHNPPHFHLKTKEYDVSIDIYTCETIKGELTSKEQKQLKNWFFHEKGKEKITVFWNRFNPENKIIH